MVIHMRIGVFDSGIGGMTVLKELIKAFPNDDYVYLGDTANVPYGTKSSKKIRELCESVAQSLKEKKLDVLIVACNTASAIALDIFKDVMEAVPVFGVVEPGVFAVMEEFKKLEYHKDRRILILGTTATIKSQIYSLEVRKHFTFNEISEQACPLAVPLIEEGWVHNPIALTILQEYVKPYVHDPVGGVALLACTHYPWAADVFQKALPGWHIVNSAKAVADFLSHQKFQIPSGKNLSIEWIFTDPEAVTEMALNDFRNLGIAIDL
jgi:glutamate racemase